MKRVNIQRDVESRERIAERSYLVPKVLEKEVKDAESEIVPGEAVDGGEPVPVKAKKRGRTAKGDVEAVSV